MRQRREEAPPLNTDWLSPLAHRISNTNLAPPVGGTAMSTLTTIPPDVHSVELPLYRLHIMRAGYLFMGLGLALVKWPLIVGGTASLPLFEGVVACLLTAMSLLAFLGLRYPARMLPILLFEVTWKVLWLATVALPRALDGELDTATQEVLINCSFVVVVAAVIPWRYAWRQYIRSTGERWR